MSDSFSLIFFVKKHLSLLVLTCFCFGLDSTAQSLDAYRKEGNKAYATGDYYSAMEYYSTVLRQDRDDYTLWLRYADCAQRFNAFQEAEKVLLRLYRKKTLKETIPTLSLRLADAYRSQGKYAKAKPLYAEFLNKNLGNDEQKAQAQKGISVCVFSEKKTIDEENVTTTIKHLKRSINSPYSDFGAILKGDTLLYSSYKFDFKNTKNKGKRTKILQSIKNRKSQTARKIFPTYEEGHLAHPTFTPDGAFAFFNKCKTLENGSIRCALWLTARNHKGKWLEAIQVPAPINEAASTTTQPSVAYDSAAQKLMLYFASDRAGGQGGMDIWEVELDSTYFCPCSHAKERKITQAPRFMGTPEPLTSINTAEDEATPFFHSATHTLWFASKGYVGFGAYDLFFIKKEKERWETVEHAGAPLNTAYNDLYPWWSPDGTKGYLSSNRKGAYYLDSKSKACCNDIYEVRRTFPEPAPTPPLADTMAVPPISPTITVIEEPKEPDLPPPPTFEDFKGLPLYFDNDEPDKRTRRTTTKKTYAETVFPYLDRSEVYALEYPKGLDEEQSYDALADVQDFFNDEVLAGYERLEELTEFLLLRLEQGEEVEIFLKGFTSPRAKSDYNLNLGKRRVSSVRNHFEQWSDGQLRSYIESDKLRITETSFGETTASQAISDRLEDVRNSIYSPAAARERRVEIVEIKSN